MVGPYQILHELGRGGMGVVYAALDRRLGRTVALKTLHAGPAASSPEAVARFRAEAEAVARIRHPGIVGIHEIGEHAGLPYFALEYCEGGPLSARLGGRPQNPRRSAALLAAVARAVQAAHEAGVVHRDLKPANILLDARGEAKVADFGLAKRSDSAGMTKSGAMLGTPAYMAPEQMTDFRRAGPAADVYSLGAILYECLTGRPPFLAENDVHAVYLATSTEPVPVRRLQPKVPADLETVCLRCLSKEPAGRYRSAAALADDLERFLRGEPTRARPPGPAERAVRWVRGNPAWAALAGVTAFGVGLLAVFAAHLSAARSQLVEAVARAESEAAAARQAESAAAADRDRARQAETEARGNLRSARENFDLARRAVKECLDLAEGHPIFQRPGMQDAKALLLRTALPYHERFRTGGGTGAGNEGGPAGDRQAREAFAEAAFNAAKESARVSSKADAVEAFRKAVAEYAALCTERPNSLPLRAKLALVRNHYGNLLHDVGRREEATAEFRSALEIARAAVAAEPANADYRDLLAFNLCNIGEMMGREDRIDESMRAFREAADLFAELAAQFPGKALYRRELGAMWVNAGAMLAKSRRYSDALRAYTAGRDIFDRLAAEHPGASDYRQGAIAARVNVATVLGDLGRRAEGVPELEKAVAEAERLSAENPAVTAYAGLVGDARQNLGIALDDLGRHAEAAASFSAAAGVWARLAEANPAVPRYRAELAECRFRLGVCSVRAFKLAESREHFRAALALREKLASEQPGDPNHRRQAANCRQNIASVLSASGLTEEALKEWRTALDVRDRLTLDHPDDLQCRVELYNVCVQYARALAAAGQADEAKRYARHAVDRCAEYAAKFPQITAFADIRGWAEDVLAGKVPDTESVPKK
jgi:serine/threonine-protein kinase